MTDDFGIHLSSGPPLLLDGPMGTELHRAGVDTGLPLWSAWGLINAPEAVVSIHRGYVDAGARILTTNTFRTHRRSLGKAGLSDRAAELTTLAVRLARDAAAGERNTAAAAMNAGGPAATDDAPPPGSSRVWVAGSVAPLEDCFSPQLTPPEPELEREHAELVAHLDTAGVDLLLVETMPTIREAVAAARGAVATGKPVLVGFTCNKHGDLISGESIEDAARATRDIGAQALLINCTPTHILHRALERLVTATALPIGAYGNVGHTEDESGWTSTDEIDPAGYVEYARRWQRAGARVIGSCCGTTAAHTAALAEWLGESGGDR